MDLTEDKTQDACVCSKTVIVFDWDDTLLSSSFLASKGYRLDSEMEKGTELESHLKQLGELVCNILELALKLGHVHIITNAEHGWVQLSAQKFLPQVVPLLSKVQVISARTTFESRFPDSPLKWKYHAFQDGLHGLYTLNDAKVRKNVISLGDSHVEREAVRAVTRGLPNTQTKSVKFAERPSLEQLRHQIELVIASFHTIHDHDGNLDLELHLESNDGSNPSSTHGLYFAPIHVHHAPMPPAPVPVALPSNPAPAQNMSASS